MFVAEVLIIAFGWPGWSEWEGLLALVLALVLTLALAFVVISITGKFGLYALSVFVGVGGLIAVATYVRTYNESKVAPVAAVERGSPVTGFFVAETSDAVYVAQPKKARRRRGLDPDATIRRLPKDSLTSLTVGRLLSKALAYRRSIHLALALCKRPKTRDSERKRVKDEDIPQLACSTSEIDALRSTLAQV